jgi:cell division protein FtsN
MNMSTSQCKQQQTGGTALGLIIGVVFGLAAALAVAVYVTKVPVPFVNKGQTRSADQDAAEAKKNKDWDPNAPLQGKVPLNAGKVALPGVPASAAAPAVSSLPATAPAVAGNPDIGVAASPPVRAEVVKPAASAAKAETRPITVATPAPPAVPAIPSAAGDPLGDLARAKSSNSGAEPFSYFVQVGAYRTADDAEAQRARLSLGGVEARVTEREQSGRVVFRVRAGPFDKKEDADRVKEKLESAGLETALVRVQR